MKDKFNEATLQRPEGDRILDAPMVTMDLSSLTTQIRQEPAWQNSDRNSITILKNRSMQIMLIALHAGAEMKTHPAPGQISVQVLEGQIKFNTEQQSAELSEGQMLSLRQGIQHSVMANIESIFLLTISLGNPTAP